MANITIDANGTSANLESPNPYSISVVNGRLVIGKATSPVYSFGCGLTYIYERLLVRVSENGIEMRVDYAQCGGKAAVVAVIDGFVASCLLVSSPPPPTPKPKTEENYLQFKSGQTIDKAVLLSHSSYAKLFSVDITVISSAAKALLIRNLNNGNLNAPGGSSTGTQETQMKWLDPNNPNDFGTSSNSWEGMRYSDDSLEECSDFKLKINEGHFGIAWTTFE